jgi:hypothetical protein
MNDIIFNYDFFINWYKSNQYYDDIFGPGLYNNNIIEYFSFSQGKRDMIQYPKNFIYLSNKYGPYLSGLNSNFTTRLYNRLNKFYISIKGNKIYFVFPRQDININSDNHRRIWGDHYTFLKDVNNNIQPEEQINGTSNYSLHV